MMCSSVRCCGASGWGCCRWTTIASRYTLPICRWPCSIPEAEKPTRCPRAEGCKQRVPFQGQLPLKRQNKTFLRRKKCRRCARSKMSAKCPPFTFGGGFGLGGLPGERGVRDLGGIEKLGAGFLLDGTDEQPVSDAGDEVADVLLAGEWRHGASIGEACFAVSMTIVLSFGNFRLVNALPDAIAVSDDGVSGDESRFIRLDGCGDGLNGFCHAGSP